MDKSMKKVLLIGAVMIALLLAVSSVSEPRNENEAKPTDNELETLLAAIEGVDQVRVVFYYNQESSAKDKQEVSGIAVVYAGSAGAQAEKKMYELISSLYGIPYSRIYVSR